MKAGVAVIAFGFISMSLPGGGTEMTASADCAATTAQIAQYIGAGGVIATGFVLMVTSTGAFVTVPAAAGVVASSNPAPHSNLGVAGKVTASTASYQPSANNVNNSLNNYIDSKVM